MTSDLCLRWAPMIGARPGELTPEEEHGLAEHLAGCDGCVARLADETALSGMLSQALLDEANRRDFATFSDGVLARIPERAWGGAPGSASAGHGQGGFLGWFRRHRAAAVAAVLAPALAALAAVLYVGQDHHDVPEAAYVEVTSEMGGATVLDTKDGPVVLLGEGEPEGT